MSDPIFPFDVWPQQIVQASVPANRNALRSQVLGSTITSTTQATQPAEPDNGALYVVPAGATGSAWDGFSEDDLAIFVDGAWYAFAPVEGLVMAGPEGELVYTAVGWVPYSSSGGATVFTQLGDVPSDYTGQEGRLVAVNETGDGLVFVAGGGGGVESFVDLTDTPSSYTGQAGRVPVVNTTEDGLVFSDWPEPPVLASTFVELEDTPSDYTGQAGRVVLVNAGEDGLEFGDMPEPVPALESFVELTDTPEDYTGQEGRLVAVNDTADGLEFVDMPEPVPGASTFIELEDTPGDYTGAGGYRVVVSEDEDGLVFLPDTPVGSSSFIELTDTPADYTGQAGRVPVVNEEEDGLEFVELPTPGPGSESFVDLSDTPADYTGAAGYKVVVNAGEDGLQFVPDSGGGGGSDVDWVNISSDFEPPTTSTASGALSTAIGPGAQAVGGDGVFAFPSSLGAFGDSEGYALFDESIVGLFSEGDTVELLGFPEAREETFGNYGLWDPEDPTTITTDRAPVLFAVGSTVTVSNSPGGVLDGDYVVVAKGLQSLTLGDGFSVSDEADLNGALFTGTVPSANGSYVVTAVYNYQLNLQGLEAIVDEAPEGARVEKAAMGGAMALGPFSSASADNAVALGFGTSADQPNSVAVGGRRVVSVGDPVNNDDAVTLNYFNQNLPRTEAYESLSGTLEESEKEFQYYGLMYQSHGSGGFYDGKIVAVSDGGEVSSWTFSFHVFVDNSGAATVSAWALTPVSVNPAHDACEFEAVVDPTTNSSWKFVYSNPGGTTLTRFSASIRRTVAFT